eukprot:2136999-Alexandrium_andersonii.AAC.1
MSVVSALSSGPRLRRPSAARIEREREQSNLLHIGVRQHVRGDALRHLCVHGPRLVCEVLDREDHRFGACHRAALEATRPDRPSRCASALG